MGTALGNRCKLEEDRFCDFTKYHCHFNYSDMRDADHHSSFMELLSKPLKATEDNKGCNLPDDTKEMTISIEPCLLIFPQALTLAPNIQTLGLNITRTTEGPSLQ